VHQSRSFFLIPVRAGCESWLFQFHLGDGKLSASAPARPLKPQKAAVAFTWRFPYTTAAAPLIYPRPLIFHSRVVTDRTSAFRLRHRISYWCEVLGSSSRSNVDTCDARWLVKIHFPLHPRFLCTDVCGPGTRLLYLYNFCFRKLRRSINKYLSLLTNRIGLEINPDAYWSPGFF
jgi:hypothetical protein